MPISEGSGASSFSEYKYDNIHLPPAGLSSGRLKHYWGKVANNSSAHVDFSLIQMPPENIRQDPAEFVGMRSLIDPSGYNDPAGNRSERVLHRKEYGIHDWECEPVEPGASKLNRSDEIRKFKIYTPQPRAKAAFSKHSSKKTDPITHFGAIYRKAEGKGYRPGRRYGYTNEASAQNWTWKQDKASWAHMKDIPMTKTRSEQKFQISVRGERAYNVCGTEDLLPAATEEFIKCDVPPPKAYIMANDKKFLPFCARAADSDAYQSVFKSLPTTDPNQSSQIWSCMTVRDPLLTQSQGSFPNNGNVRATSSRGSVRSMASPSESSFLSRASKTSGKAPRPMSAGPTVKDLNRRNALQESGIAERLKDPKTRGTRSSSQLQNSDPGRRRSASASSIRRSRSSGSLGSRRSQSKLMTRRNR